MATIAAVSQPSPANTSTPRYRALIQLLRTAEHLWNASRVFFARWNLSPSQFNVLNVLHGEPEGLSQSQLSRLLIMHRSNATGLVDRLERRGLVRRHENPDDRRAYKVALTEAGARLIETIHPHYFAAADKVWADLSDGRVETLLGELQELARNAEAVAASLPAGSLGSEEAPSQSPRSRPARRRSPRSKPSLAPASFEEALRTSDL